MARTLRAERRGPHSHGGAGHDLGGRPLLRTPFPWVAGWVQTAGGVPAHVPCGGHTCARGGVGLTPGRTQPRPGRPRRAVSGADTQPGLRRCGPAVAGAHQPGQTQSPRPALLSAQPSRGRVSGRAGLRGSRRQHLGQSPGAGPAAAHPENPTRRPRVPWACGEDRAVGRTPQGQGARCRVHREPTALPASQERPRR